MHKAVLMALGLVAAVGLIFLATQRRSAAPPRGAENQSPPASAASNAPGPAAPSAPAPVPAAPGRTGATPPPGAPAAPPDARIDRVDGKLHFTDPVALARRMHTSDTSPAEDVAAVGTALHYYQLVFKQHPNGSLNREIISQLTGDNPRGVVVIPPDHPDINTDGELLDRWGTPYFFHGLTRTAMDVWSAGPDRKFGTIDDVKLGLDDEFRKPLGLVSDP